MRLFASAGNVYSNADVLVVAGDGMEVGRAVPFETADLAVRRDGLTAWVAPPRPYLTAGVAIWPGFLTETSGVS